ncbi:hypothetical protein GCM10022408_37480 [Hymenobacter fastidiosus]|uniref:Uncharacterized protein n=1 Tax=Hymenobacter fastidiosus TaxID=486264 RepID=A0ABP7T2J1_9BACT
MQNSALEKSVVVAGELHYEDSKGWTLLKEKRPLFSLLTSVPVLAFSPTGTANICRRFSLTGAELECCIVALLGENLMQSRPEWAAQDMAQVTKPAPELLETIRKAVTTKSRRKATAKPKQSKNAKKVGEGRANG